MKYNATRSGAVLWSFLLFAPAHTLLSQGTLAVVSTNDGAGQFSWTFSSIGGVFPIVDHFQMKLYGVQQTVSPEGWSASVDADDVVLWSYIGGGGAPFSGLPLTFSIQSTSAQPILYGGVGNVAYPDGLYWGNVVLGRFMYEGPAQVPEPSAAWLCVTAAGLLAGLRRNPARATELDAIEGRGRIEKARAVNNVCPSPCCIQ